MPHGRTRARERAGEIDVSPSKLLAEIDGLRGEIESLRGELDAARKQADEYLAALQRERAEFVNFRRRTAEERERDLGLAGEGLIRKVLGIADDFDRAIENRPEALADDAWAEGVAAIDRKLRLLLESEGVRPIEASPGRPFDPREHEAIANVPAAGRREGEIVEEVQRGYRLRDRVLRPSLVAVATGGDSAGDTGSDSGDEPPASSSAPPAAERQD